MYAYPKTSAFTRFGASTRSKASVRTSARPSVPARPRVYTRPNDSISVSVRSRASVRGLYHKTLQARNVQIL